MILASGPALDVLFQVRGVYDEIAGNGNGHTVLYFPHNVAKFAAKILFRVQKLHVLKHNFFTGGTHPPTPL